MRRCLACIASIAIALTGAVALAGNGAHLSMVPWKVCERGAQPDPSPLIVFWVPSSPEEVRRSELLTSDELTLYSSQCVAMRIVRLDDHALLERLGIDGELPVVLLADANGKVLSRAATASLDEVETMVREELHERAEAAEARLDEADEKAEAGEIEAAAVIYREVWGQRCVCPRQARAAHRALKRLASK